MYCIYSYNIQISSIMWSYVLYIRFFGYRFCILVGVFAHGDIYRVIKSNPSSPDPNPLILLGVKSILYNLTLTLDNMRLVCGFQVDVLVVPVDVLNIRPNNALQFCSIDL